MAKGKKTSPAMRALWPNAKVSQNMNMNIRLDFGGNKDQESVVINKMLKHDQLAGLGVKLVSRKLLIALASFALSWAKKKNELCRTRVLPLLADLRSRLEYRKPLTTLSNDGLQKSIDEEFVLLDRLGFRTTLSPCVIIQGEILEDIGAHAPFKALGILDLQSAYLDAYAEFVFEFTSDQIEGSKKRIQNCQEEARIRLAKISFISAKPGKTFSDLRDAV